MIWQARKEITKTTFITIHPGKDRLVFAHAAVDNLIKSWLQSCLLRSGLRLSGSCSMVWHPPPQQFARLTLWAWFGTVFRNSKPTFGELEVCAGPVARTHIFTARDGAIPLFKIQVLLLRGAYEGKTNNYIWQRMICLGPLCFMQGHLI